MREKVDSELLSIWLELFDMLDLLVSVIDDDYNIVKANRKMEETFGEVLGRKCYEIFHSSDSPPPYCQVKALSEGKEVGEVFEESLGRWIRVKVREVEVGGKRRFLHIVEDITGTKYLEHELTKQRAISAEIFENARSIILAFDEHEKIVFSNRMARDAGISVQTFDELLNLVSDKNGMLKFCEKLKREGVAELTVSIADRKVWWIGSKIELNSEEIFVLIGNDVTEAERIKRELRESEEKYRTLVETMEDVVFTLDGEGKFTFVSKRFEDSIGYGTELLGKPFLAIVPPEYREIVKRGFEDVNGRTLITLEFVKKDGSRIPVEVSITNLHDAVNGRIGVARDISERVKMERRIEERTELLRLINRILRHDISNDLSVIAGAVDLLRSSQPERKEILEAIDSAVRRSFDLIKRMGELENLTLANGLRDVEVHEIAKEVLEAFKVEYGVDGEVTGECKAMADDALKSVFNNLIRNAIIHGKTERIEIIVGKNDDFCEIKVKDFGTGIPAEIRNSIFEEGFAYGESGKTGLGLYIVRKVIERYGGSVEVEENTPNGTVFILKIPSA